MRLVFIIAATRPLQRFRCLLEFARNDEATISTFDPTNNLYTHQDGRAQVGEVMVRTYCIGLAKWWTSITLSV